MDGSETTILIAYAAVVVLAVLATIAVWLSTRSRRPIDAVRMGEFEKRWLVIVAALLVALLAATIWFTPYGHSTPSGAQVVHVDASQFFWRVSPKSVRVGRPVAFVTRSSDVNHGFGIYRGNKLIAQIQVVPGAASTIVHTFRHAGEYRVLCLEFCGVGHDRMETTFRVMP